MSTQAVDPRLENFKTTDSRSPLTQKCTIQEINEDRQIHKIYHFENCGTIYLDSLNAHNVRMENCGNNMNDPCSLFFFSFSLSPHFCSHLTRPCYSDHRPSPRIIGNEKVLHSQPPNHGFSNGMWALGPSPIRHDEYVLPSLGPQNGTGPQTTTAPAETAKSDMHLIRNALPPLQSPQPIPPSHFSGDHTHHNIKCLEQLLDSSLATVIQFSGNTLADVLTPRAYDAFKALHALAALDAAASSTKPRGSEPEIPNCSAFPDVGNDCPYSSNHLPPFRNSNLTVPRTDRINISISVHYVILFSWAGMAALSFLVVFFNLPRLCERDA